MPKSTKTKYVDTKKLTIISVYGEKKFRIKHQQNNIFFTVNEQNFEKFEKLYPQRTALQKQRFQLLDTIVRAAYDAGYEDGKKSRDKDNE
jgi:LAS superfamily LD-carboxypeptidase LdcB